MPGIRGPGRRPCWPRPRPGPPVTGAQPASYAGLAPVTRRSGSSIRGEHVSHGGNKRLKRAMSASALRLPTTPTPSPGPTTNANQARAKRLGPGRPRPGPPPHPDPARHDPQRHPLRPTTNHETTHRHLTHHTGTPPGGGDVLEFDPGRADERAQGIQGDHFILIAANNPTGNVRFRRMLLDEAQVGPLEHSTRCADRSLCLRTRSSRAQVSRR